MVNLRNQGQFEEIGEKPSSAQWSGKVSDMVWVLTLGQVIKGQILVNKVLKEGEIIHVSQCESIIMILFSH